MLKLGYKCRTAKKPVALPSGRVVALDFYGPRLVTTTKGVEPVLGSRCVFVATSSFDGARAFCDINQDTLRDELHVVGMVKAAEVERRYRELVAGRTDREGEIWAPLEAVADVLGSPMMAAALARRRAAAQTKSLSLLAPADI